ncbi:hypothetical protein B0H63DRAFT_387233 [Podospora didyma]|uniref:Glycine-rich domain-containing protein 1 n=1 Tax=Podospora didyma TaxID=330526 RepID=A0AAE0P5W5_9PEZI|nr:hypothetical protein B0H63DRAFT_387233 [Podospora didyma]
MSKRASILKKGAALFATPSESSRHDENAQDGPPAYNAFSNDQFVPDGQMPAVAEPPPDPVNLIAAFDKLKLNDAPANPANETCLAHLKLLFAIQSMKEDVGYTDGLWGLWDSIVGPLSPVPVRSTDQSPDAERSPEEKMRDGQLALLSKVREKRWALFVARAVERYEVWWKMLPGRPLTERDMEDNSSEAYMNFTSALADLVVWNESMLPPLDVLMVWHTHMLNPRAFLEDAMLAGLRSFWATGMPWATINKAIDTDFAYNVSDDCKASWVSRTGLSWENADDPLVKSMRCPRCNFSLEIPWTTCCFPETYKSNDHEQPDLIGSGYGDGQLQYSCSNCQLNIRKELLSAAKFAKDTQALLGPSARPMPGTILDPKSGMPTAASLVESTRNMEPRTFPNRMLKSGVNSMRTKMTGLITSYSYVNPSMEDVRKEIDKVFKDRLGLREIDGLHISVPGVKRSGGVTPTARICVRKMMSRYWENFSYFALDLCGGVMRQGIFIEKMFKLDWLHSPAATNTMTRLLTKYDRFFTIMQTNPNKITVPTLDVDLAWHTHQLSPSAYYRFCVSRTKKFVDHDDKIDENTLNLQFEWTSKEYQDRFGEVYSECTCWYCESIRSSHISSVGKLLGKSKQEKVAESFHLSGAAQLCPPSNSAHISSHNSVRPMTDPRLQSFAALARRHVQAQLAAAQKKRLDAAYAKARARAEKKGRKIPPRDEYYDHWGYPYAYYGPYMYPMWFMPGMYYGYGPAYVAACGGGSGWGSCAAGTCGGGVAAGACGGPGGCGGDGAGGAGGCGGGCSGGGGKSLFLCQLPL